jgi:hypothetical protein
MKRWAALWFASASFAEGGKLTTLNPHFFLFIESRFVVAPVVELSGARGVVGGHVLRVLQCSVALEVVGNSSGAHGVIADAGLDGRRYLREENRVLREHAFIAVVTEIPRSAIMIARSRKLCLKLVYQLTHKMMICRSRCRPLNRSSNGTNRCISSSSPATHVYAP